MLGTLVCLFLTNQDPIVPDRATRTLVAAELNAVVPTWLPDKFVYQECRLDLGQEPVETMASLEFWGEDGRLVVLDMASDGLGDLPMEGPDGKVVPEPELVAVNVGLLGPISFDYAKVGDWTGFQTTWERASGQGFPHFVRVSGTGLSKADAKKMIENLARLGG